MVAPAPGLPVRALVVGSVVWNEKFAGTELVGTITQFCPAAVPALRIVANTAPEFPTWSERLVGSRAAASGPADAPPEEFTTTFKTPVLLCQPTPSTTPRNKRVAPAGTTNCWMAPVPVPVMPSPMKNGCFRAGLNVAKLVPKPGELKSNRVGAPDDVGILSSRNSPTSASCGASIPAMLLLDGVPSSPKVPIVLNTPPSGESVGVPPMKLTLPLTLNVSTVPGVSEMPTCTGESAGAVSDGVASGAQHADPLGMPARYGFALPGTVTPTVAPRAGDTAIHTSAIAPRSIRRAHISAPLGSVRWLPSNCGPTQPAIGRTRAPIWTIVRGSAGHHQVNP